MTTYSAFSPKLPAKSGEVIHWGQLYGAAAALAISAVAHNHKSLTVVLTSDMLTVTRLEYELKFFLKPNEILLTFPDWETLPYDSFSPHQDIISQRLLTLYKLPNFKKGILIVPINTLLTRIAPRNYVEGNSFILFKGDLLNLDQFRKRLETHGYRCVAQVMEHGEFAIRGSILDLYPMGSPLPFRVDLFDNEVDSIRTFDPETQRTVESIEKINLLPAREFPLTEDAIALFRQTWRAKFSGNPSNSPFYQSVSQGESAAGIEYYLPLFFENMATLLDYLPLDSLLIQYDNLTTTAENFWAEIRERYEQLRYDQTKPLLPPDELFITPHQLNNDFKKFPLVQIQQQSVEENADQINFATRPIPDLTIDRLTQPPLHKLANFLDNLPDTTKILFSAETLGRKSALEDLLKTIHIEPKEIAVWQDFLQAKIKIAITTATLETGLYLTDPALVLIPESQLLGQPVMQRRLRKRRHLDPDVIIRNLTELEIGAPVVHIDHGIGLYKGLQLIKIGAIEAEYLTLEYAEAAKLYVPVSALHLIGRYTGVDAEHVSLHQLGSKQWEKTKRKAAEKIRDVAAELLDIYARRAIKQGHTFNLPEQNYHLFAADFPFEETPDQQQAIQDVITDMVSSRIMDRLICGDVGFGKTEVALRAAFLAVQDGKQVAVFVPTTLLAEQHFQTFKDRFAKWPIKVAVLSRFHRDSDLKKTLEDIKEGKIDIIIGTHKLLQPDVKFKSLGLLIIDEEHRFGVQQKERIKALRSEVDILTLTATPIPRTLNMSMSRIRDLSLITTPPARRLSVKTFVREFNSSLIREAILREIMRGGQVYFLHNDIVTIEKMQRDIQQWVPEARIAIAHGQMPEKELAQVMTDFYHQRFNVLICTTIVESGIDIPTANTIIVNRADRFGLAQLHQLRGRVGRSHHQAYAYLLVSSFKAITSDAMKRLEAIESLEELGAGFLLATQDLEIRGAGELLGEEQSGHIQAIGFSLYSELLEEAVKSLKAGKEPNLDKPLHHGTEIDLHVTALIPETWVPDVHTRLTLYKRISNAKSDEELRDLQVEMIDRFGLLPEATKNLFSLAELRLKAQLLGINKIDVGPKFGRIEFDSEPRINLKQLLQLMQNHPKKYKLDSAQRLQFSIDNESLKTRIETVEFLLKQLTS